MVLFWSEDLVGVKWPDNGEIRENEGVLSRRFKYNVEYIGWERNKFRNKC